jgi:hypothetical protein
MNALTNAVAAKPTAQAEEILRVAELFEEWIFR